MGLACLLGLQGTVDNGGGTRCGTLLVGESVRMDFAGDGQGLVNVAIGLVDGGVYDVEGGVFGGGRTQGYQVVRHGRAAGFVGDGTR